MSDRPRGSDWWQASDGKWYPPESRPAPPPPPPPQPPPTQAGRWSQGSDGDWLPPEAVLDAKPPRKRGRGWLKGILVVLGIVIVIGVVASLVGEEEGSGSPEPDSPAAGTRSSSPDPRPSPAAAPESQFTRSQENAIRSAESYLSFSAFSRSGLIDQLEFEGFTNAEATLAVDSLQVDWNEQAWMSAESYLEFSGFSRSGLIDQLLFEGFTQSEATYGADKAGLGSGPAAASGSQLTRSQENAIRSAESYLDFSAFSRSGLIEQLEFEGFTNAEATLAVDSLGVDWNEQAWMSAESYLEFSSFSRSGLIDQLLFEGFTRSQATYGVNKAGL